jgi:hypothetical protein
MPKPYPRSSGQDEEGGWDGGGSPYQASSPFAIRGTAPPTTSQQWIQSPVSTSPIGSFTGYPYQTTSSGASYGSLPGYGHLPLPSAHTAYGRGISTNPASYAYSHPHGYFPGGYASSNAEGPSPSWPTTPAEHTPFGSNYPFGDAAPSPSPSTEGAHSPGSDENGYVYLVS